MKLSTKGAKLEEDIMMPLAGKPRPVLTSGGGSNFGQFRGQAAFCSLGDGEGGGAGDGGSGGGGGGGWYNFDGC